MSLPFWFSLHSLRFLSVFPFSKDFRGSAGRRNLCLFGGFPCCFPKRQGKEDQGLGVYGKVCFQPPGVPQKECGKRSSIPFFFLGTLFNNVQTRCIVKAEAQKSPLFWRFSGGFDFSQDRLFSRNSTRKPLNLVKSPIFTNAPCKTTCLYNALVCTLLIGHFLVAFSDFRGPKTHPKSRNTKKTPRSRELFRKVRANFSLLPCDTSQEPQRKLFRKTCSDELFYFGWILFGWIFLLSWFICHFFSSFFFCQTAFAGVLLRQGQPRNYQMLGPLAPRVSLWKNFVSWIVKLVEDLSREIYCAHFSLKLKDENLQKFSPNFHHLCRRYRRNISPGFRSRDFCRETNVGAWKLAEIALSTLYFSDSGRWPFHTPPIHTPTKRRPIEAEFNVVMICRQPLSEIPRRGVREGALRKFVANCAPNLRKIAGISFRESGRVRKIVANLSRNFGQFYANTPFPMPPSRNLW